MKARKIKKLDPDAGLADNAERIVRTRLDELCGFMPAAADPEAVETLHDMRIAAKRLRYILEMTAEPCFGPYARTAAKRTKGLQDLLGDIHDCDETLPQVLGLLDAARREDSAAVAGRVRTGAEDLTAALAAGAPNAGAYRGLETFAGYLRTRRDLLFTRFEELWRELQREGFRARLEYAVAERPQGDVTPASQIVDTADVPSGVPS